MDKPTQPVRRRLPNRREAQTVELRYGPDDAQFHVTLGFFDDGRPGEMFLHGAKVGSDADGLHADVGLLLSRLLQLGDTLEAIATGMARLGDGRNRAPEYPAPRRLPTHQRAKHCNRLSGSLRPRPGSLREAPGARKAAPLTNRGRPPQKQCPCAHPGRS